MSEPSTTDRADVDVILWQGRLRVMVAALAGGSAFLLSELGWLRGHGTAILLTTLGYVAIVLLVAGRARFGRRAGDSAIAITVVADLCFVFAMIALTSSPGHLERGLIVAFFVVHVTESYFGRAHAVAAVLEIVAGYIVLLAITSVANRSRVGWPDELWSLALFTIAASVFVLQYGGFQRRLQNIVALFARAEDGDFGAYDVRADKTPDAITLVGQAYNRVRLQLASMMVTDPLTGCLNRRGFDQALARELARATRSGAELSLFSLDLDHFKDVNDTYGHLAGDVVLREFGGLLVQTARAGDLVARTGGEEFSLLLPDTDAAGALKAALRVCEAVRLHKFLVNGKRVQVTLSGGVVSMNHSPTDAAGANLKERADEALYAAKRGGRDQVRVWDAALTNVS